MKIFPRTRIEGAQGFEIDITCGHKAIELWQEHKLNLQLTDFTRTLPPALEEEKNNLLICNPPYVRHHHLSKIDKQRLQTLSEQIAGVKLSQQTGLYGYFLCLSHAWLVENGLAGWLIPAEFMDVNYGQKIRKYLLTKVTLLRIHRFDPKQVQFDDALVSSAIVWFQKASPLGDHKVEFTYGGTLIHPVTTKKISIKELSNTGKWNKLFISSPPQNSLGETINARGGKIPLSNLFDIKRGLATGANSFFILSGDKVSQYQIPVKFLTPILPNARYLPYSEIQADENGNPITSQSLFLLTCDLPENDVETSYPSLWKYLQMGIEEGIHNRFLCRNRKPWYSQEKRQPCMFICTYMGRQSTKNKTPFRFILNHSKALVTNSYLILYPRPLLAEVLHDRPEMAKLVWQELTRISATVLLEEGRVYGGGLYKMEPKELANVPADNIFSLFRSYQWQ